MMNPEALRDAANIVLIVGLIIAACGTFGVNYFRSQAERARAAAAIEKDQLSDSRATTLQSNVDDLVVGKDELLRQNSALSALVESLRGQVGARDLTIEHLNSEIAATKGIPMLRPSHSMAWLTPMATSCCPPKSRRL